MNADSTDEELIAYARDKYAALSDGDVDIDPWQGDQEPQAPSGGSARVSRGDDGAYVLAWVYVRFSDDDQEDETVDAFIYCKFCDERAPANTAHLHQGTWVGDECCWDERLRSTE